MEIISWGIGGPKWIWIVPDIINSSRGVLIFVFCVWTNKKIRLSLANRLDSRKGAGHPETTFASKTCPETLESQNDPSVLTPLKNDHYNDTVL